MLLARRVFRVEFLKFIGLLKLMFCVCVCFFSPSFVLCQAKSVTRYSMCLCLMRSVQCVKIRNIFVQRYCYRDW